MRRFADHMQNSNKRKYGAIAVVVVALTGAGSALAASKIHLNSGSNRAAGGPPGGFAGQNGGPMQGGYGFQGGGPPNGGGGFGDRRRGAGGLEAAATYLGISTSQLFSDLQSGKSLEDIAKATDGKSTQGLIDAMVAAEKQQLDSAVGNGMITQAQADQIESSIETRVTAMVNGTGFGRRGGGFGPPSGGQGNGSPPGTTL
jgi:hypothetical protein